ncbi:hypothetical protein SERLA73DRAFT_191307 [Serpula lacrymans var. lacrymans S7.3]|uniref:Uncharacterized protein n=2 Tax=Serpula lacrymans var. lacrymans TaxID=341189 RepID=F8QH97_SERL3|nr:uncharacterized protein SERLADRAFT_459930 [Serpula lacrymans var. lacrymans S7.9]EGN92346.1 hypothetical protein SERLA73DRAFT_191307 [Serpula lacrymans var. lacrymans S7.3]EGO27098.1 hypothetical protein SERLADRAFT_459930 [Serpula lacrymans var. lacrymans S7.9]
MSTASTNSRRLQGQDGGVFLTEGLAFVLVSVNVTSVVQAHHTPCRRVVSHLVRCQRK